MKMRQTTVLIALLVGVAGGTRTTAVTSPCLSNLMIHQDGSETRFPGVAGGGIRICGAVIYEDGAAPEEPSQDEINTPAVEGQSDPDKGVA